MRSNLLGRTRLACARALLSAASCALVACTAHARSPQQPEEGPRFGEYGVTRQCFDRSSWRRIEAVGEVRWRTGELVAFVPEDGQALPPGTYLVDSDSEVVSGIARDAYLQSGGTVEPLRARARIRGWVWVATSQCPVLAICGLCSKNQRKR